MEDNLVVVLVGDLIQGFRAFGPVKEDLVVHLFNEPSLCVMPIESVDSVISYKRLELAEQKFPHLASMLIKAKQEMGARLKAAHNMV